ncbi:hypothetical protein PPYR_05978 [Photinus pyralis]|uniref:Uncharacterized protein n=1 Tax=Photinus pyralis TaxID=7054 RepID=A0A1Y1MY94_PHOPY|nr:uncharacterized protein LOC116166729 [Photinus pyralis]XP_031337669.1 uncharacterized protein LOC116166729 [Photinus pyralis]XP_031337670.1 uncharacterized protein LOC116166729 [Photinus pyralis]KAB0800238.1 hypothetical protein PPYR_05978 [Photinus pyralis]
MESIDESDEEAELDSSVNRVKMSKEDSWLCDMLWSDMRSMPHTYIPLFPKQLKKGYNLRINCELPYPIFDSIVGIHPDNYWIPFSTKLNKDTRFDYYKKLYSSSRNKIGAKDLQKNVISIPTYLINVALDPLDPRESGVWSFTGGFLDCGEYDQSLYIANVVKPHSVRFVDVGRNESPVYLNVDKRYPIYSVKCNKQSQSPLIVIRQSRKVCVFQLSADSESHQDPVHFGNRNCFMDVEFSHRVDQLCYVNSSHNATIKDLRTCQTISKRKILPIRDNLPDCHAQIVFLDVNTIAFINRCCLFLLDLRSSSFYALCLKQWFGCDDLCTIAIKDDRTLYITTIHNIIEVNIQALKVSNKVMHMMTSPPFISSLIDTLQGPYCGLLGSHAGDTAIFNGNDFNIPQYVSNINDTLRLTSSVRKLAYFGYLKERFGVPTVGMKLQRDPNTHDIFMFTSNSVGDVFQQKVSCNTYDKSDIVNKLEEWVRKLSVQQKPVTATSVCNLNRAWHAITTHFPKQNKINNFAQENTSRRFWKKYSYITKDISSKVGEAINALWVEDDVIKEPGVITSQDKVMEWLQSTS